MPRLKFCHAFLRGHRYQESKDQKTLELQENHKGLPLNFRSKEVTLKAKDLLPVPSAK